MHGYKRQSLLFRNIVVGKCRQEEEADANNEKEGSNYGQEKDLGLRTAPTGEDRARAEQIEDGGDAIHNLNESKEL